MMECDVFGAIFSCPAGVVINSVILVVDFTLTLILLLHFGIHSKLIPDKRCPIQWIQRNSRIPRLGIPRSDVDQGGVGNWSIINVVIFHQFPFLATLAVLSQLIVVSKFTKGNPKGLMRICGVLSVRQRKQLEIAIFKIRRALIIVGFLVLVEIKEAFTLPDDLLENINVVLVVEQIGKLARFGNNGPGIGAGS